jgi:hypothetical protein
MHGWGATLLKSYDFDIVRLGTTAAGVTSAADAPFCAMFRDPETRAAARGLPEAVRNWLTNAGFSFDAHRSSLPDGFYAQQDETDRLQIMQCLTATMKKYDLPKRGMDVWSNFVISDFVEAMGTARPMPSPANPAAVDPLPPVPTPFAGLRGQAAKVALAKATRRRWSPKQTGLPFGMLAMARRQGLLKLTLGTAFVYCAVLLYTYR